MASCSTHLPHTVQSLPVVKTIPIAPHAGKVTDALSRIGYSIEEASADLIDNSIDAGASDILIRFVHDGSEIRRILFADNGKGMTEDELLAAMQFGSTRDRAGDSLGKFGMGLKTAAFSQGRSLTVVTRKSGRVSCCRWTQKLIAEGWNCELLDSRRAASWLDGIQEPFAIGKNGTLVVIDEIDQTLTGARGLESGLQRLQKKLSSHLGLVFHRFLDNGTTLWIDAVKGSGTPGFSVPVNSLDPFSYTVSGDPGFPAEFTIRPGKLSALKCTAHIWPPNQTVTGFTLNASNPVSRQGFYFYRNDRLIQAGGWNGWRDGATDAELSLARIAVEMSPEYDTEFRLNVQKSGVELPETFRTALAGTPLPRYVNRAVQVYRKKIKVEAEPVPVPGKGFGAAVRRKATSYLAGRKAPTSEVTVVWDRLPADRFFTIDRDERVVRLNSSFRSDVLHGSQSSLNDVPVVKTLLFLLLRDDLLRMRESRQFTERLEEINELLMLAAVEERNRQAA
jgi:hypothetical protein